MGTGEREPKRFQIEPSPWSANDARLDLILALCNNFSGCSLTCFEMAELHYFYSVSLMSPEIKFFNA